MKEKLLKIFDEYSRKKAGYIPFDEREELVDEIMQLRYTVNTTHVVTTETKIVKEVEFTMKEKIIKIINNNAEDSELLLNPRWVRKVANEILALYESATLPENWRAFDCGVPEGYNPYDK